MLSVIVPAYNEEQLLEATLRAIHAAATSSSEPYEVIVVDDASTDCTAAIAHGLGARVIPVAYRQIAATRNAGARAAQGDWLLFVDADTVVTTAAVRAAVRALQRGAVGGGCAFRFDGRLPLYGRLLDWVGAVLYRLVGLASGCFLFCSRQAFEGVGGFDDGLFAGEEGAMSLALKRQGRFVILRQVVMTSGRKFRAYSAREIGRVMFHLAWGKGRNRAGLEIWYGDRRVDPPGDLAQQRNARHPQAQARFARSAHSTPRCWT